MALPLMYAAGAAGLSGLGSMFGGMSEAEQQNRNIAEANKAIQGVKSNLQTQGTDLTNYANQAYQPFTQNAGADMAAYRDAVMTGGNLTFQEAPDFNYNLQSNAQQFLDPMMDQKIKSATDNLQASAANRGGLFSSATGRSIAETAAEMKGDSWKEALQLALQDRGFQYGVHSDDISRDRDSVRFAAEQQALKTQGLGNLAGMGADASMNLANNVLGIKGDVYKGMNEADLAMAGNIMSRQDDSFFGNFGKGLASGLNTFGNFYSPKKDK